MRRRGQRWLLVSTLAAFLVAIAQIALPSQLQIGGARPGILVVAAMAIGLHFGAWSGLGWGLLAGLFADMLAAHPLGIVGLPVAVVGYLSGRAHALVLDSRVVIPLAAGLLGTVLSDLLQALIASLWGYPVLLGHMLLHLTLPAALYNAALTLAFFVALLPVHRLQRRSRLTVRI